MAPMDIKDMNLTAQEKLHYLTLSELLLNSGMFEKRVQYALVFALELIEEKAKVCEQG
jgi:hypothetical protein